MSLQFARFLRPGDAAGRLGVVDGHTLVDLHAADPGLPTDLIDLLSGSAETLDAVARAAAGAPTEARTALDAVRWLPPVERPGKILCLGLNYADHAAEGGNARPEYPSFSCAAPPR